MPCRSLSDQSLPQSLRYLYPAERAMDAREESKTVTTKSWFRFNCACLKLFANWTKRSSRGNFALLIHCYNLLVSKQFFFLTWPLNDVFNTKESSRKDCPRRPKKKVATKTFVSRCDTSTAVCKFKGFSIMYESHKNGIEMTFKNKANSWTNWHRSVVSCFMAKKTFFLTFSSLIRLVCTQMLSCAHGDEYVFVGQSHIVFFWFFQRLVILGADQKDHSLWERDCWEHSVMSLRLNLSYEGQEKLINFTFDTDLARDFLGF